MGDADLWGYGDDEPEPDHFSDSSGERSAPATDDTFAFCLPVPPCRRRQPQAAS